MAQLSIEADRVSRAIRACRWSMELVPCLFSCGIDNSLTLRRCRVSHSHRAHTILPRLSWCPSVGWSSRSNQFTKTHGGLSRSPRRVIPVPGTLPGGAYAAVERVAGVIARHAVRMVQREHLAQESGLGCEADGGRVEAAGGVEADRGRLGIPDALVALDDDRVAVPQDEQLSERRPAAGTCRRQCGRPVAAQGPWRRPLP